VRLYHTSDMHNHRGFAPRLRALRDEKPGLLFDCGDSLRGSQTMYYRNEPIIAEIDEAGYDAQAIGNREFSYAYPLLRARSRKMQHPLVCTNLLDTKGRELPFLQSMTMRSPSTGSGQAVTIHILGLLIMQYPVGSFYERIFGWRFLDPWDAVQPYADRMPEGDMLLVLSHVGLALDRELAQRVPRIDLILGGHSHDTLFKPEFVNGVPIVHAGPYAQYVSRTEITYDVDRKHFDIEDFALVPLLGAP
jgi:2',3'-cyclic-nucleotide 2'-phosphodiesterase (5'-nucleotidase family)